MANFSFDRVRVVLHGNLHRELLNLLADYTGSLLNGEHGETWTDLLDLNHTPDISIQLFRGTVRKAGSNSADNSILVPLLESFWGP